jgi:hypothetical protein
MYGLKIKFYVIGSGIPGFNQQVMVRNQGFAT